MNPTALLSANALLAAVPIAALLWVRRGQPEDPPRLSPGRFFLAYVLLFSALLGLTRLMGLAASMFAVGFFVGVLGTGRLMKPLYGLLYGRHWVAANPAALERDAQRWHLPMLILGVLGFVGAMIAATTLG